MVPWLLPNTDQRRVLQARSSTVASAPVSSLAAHFGHTLQSGHLQVALCTPLWLGARRGAHQVSAGPALCVPLL